MHHLWRTDLESRTELRAVMTVKVPSEAVLPGSNFALSNTLSNMIRATLNGMRGDLWDSTWPVCTQSLEIAPGLQKECLTPHVYSHQWPNWVASGGRTGQFACLLTNQSQICVWFLKPEVPTGNFRVSFEVSTSALPQSITLIFSLD